MTTKSNSTPWAGTDSPIALHIADLNRRCLEAYRANPLLVLEHANIERSTAQGGYGRRQIYELVQNGADALMASGASEGQVKILLTDKALYCANEGAPLDEKGVDAIMSSHISMKRGKEIGRFGLGFKSVLGVTKCPEVYSRTGSFCCDPEEASRRIREIVPDAETLPQLRIARAVDPDESRQNDKVLDALMEWATTVIKLPLDPPNGDWLSKDIASFPSGFLLFCPHVSSVVLADHTKNTCREITLKRGDEFVTIEEGKDKEDWKVFETVHVPSEAARADGGELADRESLALMWAVPLRSRQARGVFWAFFPTEYLTTLSGILNAPWKTNEDRQNLLKGPFNRELIDASAQLIAQSLPYIVNPEEPGKFLDLLPGRGGEAPNWADEELTKKVYEQVSTYPCIPDQNGALGFVNVVRLHSSSIPREALDMWAKCPSRPVNWCHPSIENHQRRSRIDRLFSKAGQAAMPVADWLEALVQRANALDSIPALQVAAKTLKHEPKLRSEVGASRILLTRSGTLVAPSPTAVFLPPADLDYVTTLTLVHPDVAANPEALEALTDLGIGPVDASSELQAFLAPVDLHSLQDGDWERFWRLVRSVPAETAIHLIVEHLAGEDVRGVVKARTKSGKFCCLRRMLLPGGIVLEGNTVDAVSAVDLAYHGEDELLLKGLGAVNAPEPNVDTTGEFWFLDYKDTAVSELKRRLTRGQGRPREDMLKFDRQKTVGPLEPLFFLEDEGRARFTEAALPAILVDPVWTLAHETLRHSYPIVECDSPSLFIILKQGRLRTLAGVFSVDMCLGPSLAEWSAFFPVADCTSEVARRLRLPATLPDILPKHWAYADKSAENVTDERALTAFYALASQYRHIPARIRCRIGDTWSLQPPKNVTVVCDAVQHRAMLSLEIPVIEASPQDAALLCSKWGLQPFTNHAAIEIVALPSGTDTPLLDRFPGLHFLPPGHEGATLVPCSELRQEVRMANGRIDEDHNVLRKENRIFFLDQLSDADLLRGLADNLGFPLDEETLRRILEYRIVVQERERIVKVREQETIAGKLLAAVGVEAITRRLPRGLLEAVEGTSGTVGPERLAELVFAVYGVDTLHTFREELQSNGLTPPATWAGSHNARVFVKGLGFAPEFAGFEQRRLDATLEVLGPPQLNLLHQFQEEIVGKIEQMGERTENRRGIVSLPTGAGKTRVAVEALIRIIKSKGLTGPILWVAQSEELCEQAVQTWSYVWRALGPSTPLVVSRLWNANEADAVADTPQVVVATIQKLKGCIDDPNYEWLAKASWLVIDEAHVSIATLYTKLLTWQGFGRKGERCPLIGLTATPFRGGETETERLVKRFGGLRLDNGALGEDPYAELQQMGVLAHVDHQILSGTTLDLSDQELENLTRLRNLPSTAGARLGVNVARNEMLLKSIREMPRDWPVLLFAVSVDHAQTMAALLSLEGIPAAAISGETEPGARRHYIEEFRKGQIRVLTNFAVLTAGFDAPSIRAIIVARPTYSPVLYQQMIGRGLRGPLNGGKERCMIVNVEDNITRFGEDLAFRQFEYLWQEHRGAVDL